jgi:hypothetical protein
MANYDTNRTAPHSTYSLDAGQITGGQFATVRVMRSIIIVHTVQYIHALINYWRPMWQNIGF